MKTFVQVLLVAACFVACARSFPSGLGYDSSDEDDVDSMSFNFEMPFWQNTFDRLRQNLMSYFWNVPDMTNIKVLEGANTTSTVKIINGHVVTINDTTYMSGDDNSNTVFRIRIIDVKPENETIEVIGLGGDNTEQSSVRPEPESRETVEEFNNEISKNTETLTA